MARFARLHPFFNRKVELEGLKRVTWDGGNLVLVTGPQDSGKSSLLNEFAERTLQARTGTPILVDMRDGSYNTADAFARGLKSEVLPFIASARELIKAVPTTEGYDPAAAAVMQGAKAATDVFLQCAKNVEEHPPDDMTGLLYELQRLFFHWRVTANRIGYGKQAGVPTLILDEANRLHEWSRTPEEMTHLRSLEAFFIKITKQDELGNVILCSSEDFFRFWVQSRLGYQRFKTEVVGDLVEAEAKKFFLSRLELEGELPEELWKEMYAYLGGRMNLLKSAARSMSWDVESAEQMWKNWAVFKEDSELRCLNEVVAGFNPQDIPLTWTQPALGIQVSTSLDHDLPQDSPYRPCWRPVAYKYVLEKLMKAEGGVVSEDELIRSKCITRAELYSLIQHKFLHYREKSQWAQDLSWYKGSWPVIMARSKPHQVAIPSALLK